MLLQVLKALVFDEEEKSGGEAGRQDSPLFRCAEEPFTSSALP
jgi:hypothetical protein